MWKIGQRSLVTSVKIIPKSSALKPNSLSLTPIAMAISRLLRRSPGILIQTRPCSSSSSSSSSSSPQVRRRYPPPRLHEFSNPSDYLGSWDPPSNPREAEAKLDRLRKGYAKQMKQVRREFAHEMEMLRIEKQRKDEARRDAVRIANEKRKAEKVAAAESRAVERKAFEEEFRQMMLKERAQKLESWKAKEELRENKKKEQKELLRKQSSMWVAEENLEKRILEAIVDTTPL